MGNELLEKLKIDRRVTARSTGGRRWWLLAGAAVSVLVPAIVLLLQQRGIEVTVTPVVTIHATQTFTVLNASGYVVAGRRAAVASKITGRLEWLGVEEGSRVAAGQVLARLESRDLAAALEQAKAAVQVARASLEQARAELDDARRSFERQQELLGQGVTARAEFDQAEARHRRARAAVDAARSSIRAAEAQERAAAVSLDYAAIRAPFDGLVLTKNADVGDIITPLGAAANAKAAVVTIADPASLEIEADVSESSLLQVQQGQACEILLDALPDARFRGRVHAIVPTADRAKASVLVKVRFLERDRRVLPDMSAKVAFLSREPSPEERQSRTAVNPAAVSSRGTAAHVYRLQEGKVSAVPVTVGRQLGDLVEIGGLQAGDRVVLKPLERMRDGRRVTVAER